MNEAEVVVNIKDRLFPTNNACLWGDELFIANHSESDINVG